MGGSEERAFHWLRDESDGSAHPLSSSDGALSCGLRLALLAIGYELPDRASKTQHGIPRPRRYSAKEGEDVHFIRLDLADRVDSRSLQCTHQIAILVYKELTLTCQDVRGREACVVTEEWGNARVVPRKGSCIGCCVFL